MWVQKWSKLIFSKVVPRPIGELFCTHVSAYKLQKSLEMGNLATNSAAKGVQGECGRRGAGGVLGGMSLERAVRARKGFEGGIMVEVAGIVFGVPQHASLLSPVADIPS